MKHAKKSVVILFLVISLILLVSCNAPIATQSPTPSASITPTSSPTQTLSPTPSLSPTTNSPTPPAQTPTPTPSLSPTQTPSVSPTPNPAEDKNFYIDKILSGYKQTLKPDGTFEQTPVYSDLYFEMNILGYYTKKDAVFVPRIPTFTDHDDWFIRIKIPSFLLKPWLMNWSYTLNNSSPSAASATLDMTVYAEENFNANYYLHPDKLLEYDLKGDRAISSNGIRCKYFLNPGNYVILLRTNAADAIDDFWIKLGTEASTATPTP